MCGRHINIQGHNAIVAQAPLSCNTSVLFMRLVLEAVMASGCCVAFIHDEPCKHRVTVHHFGSCFCFVIRVGLSPDGGDIP
jgi:hypothetical protein